MRTNSVLIMVKLATCNYGTSLRSRQEVQGNLHFLGYENSKGCAAIPQISSCMCFDRHNKDDKVYGWKEGNFMYEAWKPSYDPSHRFCRGSGWMAINDPQTQSQKHLEHLSGKTPICE
ncbi:hypothetical protein Hypma_014552 [Hypsizygus marmoreus]|uniref:Uncharacterized protein n=1 Tax=Hypsizygus marmoreus TaxID=39966 RepID=A0A369JC33_HYPMA|nr:hypothetical protein Hypma_014552 [Hypsizygus marmoreus]